MKRTIIPTLAALAFTLTICGQQQPSRGLAPAVTGIPVQHSTSRNLVKFDLDFPGGTPRELVEAIGKGSQQPLNAVIQDEYADVRLPALKMREVDVAQLFDALQAASRTQVIYRTGTAQAQFQSSYGFMTPGGPRDHDSVWYFYRETPPPPSQEAKICRFYQLGPYLENFKVEDITTAVQTAWKLLGEMSPPVLNYHKDTKLLIAVGEPSKLQAIDSVLQELARHWKAASPAPTATSKKNAAAADE